MTRLDHVDCVIVDGGLVTFSSDMKPDQLHQWLLQELGEDYKSDIDGLRSKPGVRSSIYHPDYVVHTMHPNRVEDKWEVIPYASRKRGPSGSPET